MIPGYHPSLTDPDETGVPRSLWCGSTSIQVRSPAVNAEVDPKEGIGAGAAGLPSVPSVTVPGQKARNGATSHTSGVK